MKPRTVEQLARRAELARQRRRAKATKQRCEQCSVELTGSKNQRFCPVCIRERETTRMRELRHARRQAAAAKEVAALGPWDSHVLPLQTRVVEVASPDPSPSLALQAVQIAASEFCRIEHSAQRLGWALTGGMASRPHAQALTDAVAVYKRVGGDVAGLDQAIRAGERSAAGGRRMESIEDALEPAELDVEAMMRLKVAV